MILGIRDYDSCRQMFKWSVTKEEYLEFKNQSDLTEHMQEIAEFDPVYHPSQFDQIKYKFAGLDSVKENFSQSWQDIFVLTMLSGKRNGTYLELGASNACYNNNTFLLEQQFDWHGLSLDFRDDIVDEWRQLRPNANLIIDNALHIDFAKLFGDNQLPKQIDYLQVDLDSTQDATLIALKRLPHHDYRFSVITFETDIFEGYETSKMQARNFLENLGYILLIDNVAVKNYPTRTWEPFEDWYIDPKVINSSIVEEFKKIDGNTKLPHKIFIESMI